MSRDRGYVRSVSNVQCVHRWCYATSFLLRHAHCLQACGGSIGQRFARADSVPHSHGVDNMQQAPGRWSTLVCQSRQCLPSCDASASEQVAALLGVDVRMLTAFPTARGLARHVQQAAGRQHVASAATGQVRPCCACPCPVRSTDCCAVTDEPGNVFCVATWKSKVSKEILRKLLLYPHRSCHSRYYARSV